jgi:hypothetical protein
MRKGIVFSFLNRFRPDCRERDESLQAYSGKETKCFAAGTPAFRKRCMRATEFFDTGDLRQ